MEGVSQCTDYLEFQLEKLATKLGLMRCENSKTFENVAMLVFDERSMISAEDMGMIETYAKQVVHQGMHKKFFWKHFNHTACSR